MRPRLRDLWTFAGTVDRGTYAFWGLSLAALKHQIDRFVCRKLTGRSFAFDDYWIPGDLFDVLPGDADRSRLALPLLAVALPFVWAGIALTLRRVRSAALPAGAILLFFVPVVNLLFFLVLCFLPARVGEGARPSPARDRLLSAILPDSPMGSAIVACLLVVPFVVALAWVTTELLGDYGWGLFVGLPFLLGMLAVVIHGYHGPRPWSECMLVASLSTLLVAGVLLVVAIEGVLCILMAAPIAVPLALLGGHVGYLLQRRPSDARDTGGAMGAVILFLPAFLGVESRVAPDPPRIEIRTAVEVDAPPERVWEHVVAFAELPPPREWIFRAGVAHPLRAVIHGEGAGAIRHCVFSTGPFVEPIEAWDAPRRLEFSVSAQPPSMRELTPYPALAPPHLEGFLVSHRGRFVLEPLAGGRTRLEGTTWYSNRMWPARYWKLWSDAIIHAIHGRVLGHIRARAEAGMERGEGAR